MSCKPELEESLHKSYEYYRQLIENSPVPIGIAQDNQIIFINLAGAHLFGASGPEGFTGSSLPDLVHPSDRKEVTRQFNKVVRRKKAVPLFDAKIIRMNGTVVDVEIAAGYFLNQDKPAVQFSLREISKRKEMEELFFQSRHDWEETFHAITDMITVHDKDFNIIYANRAAQDILGLPAHDGKVLNKCFQFYHGAECPPEGCPSCNCLNTGEPANFEIFEPHLNMYIEIRSMPRFDSRRRLIGLIHITRDVTERKIAEQAIQKAKDELELRVEDRTRELKIANDKLTEEITERKAAVEALKISKNRYRNLSQEFHTLLNGIPDNLLLLSPDLKIMWANKAVASVFHKEAAELDGKYCYSLCCDIVSPCDKCPTLMSFASGKEESAQIMTDEDRVWDIRAFPIKDESGYVKNVIELARDITDKVNLEAGATRTRHLASLGELAAGVAHEINNPINNIINYAQILIDEFTGEKRDDEIARRIIKDGDRIATIVRSLLSFARIRKEDKCIMSLHEIFSDTLSLTSAQIRKDGIHIKVDIPSKPIKIHVHPQQIQQVFLNLISNSRFALNQKYPGTHENKAIDVQCDEITVGDQRYVRITFIDYGEGIPAHIIDKVVNPFFSTKPNRMGTGLGLSISHGIITEHGGKLLIDSVEGENTKLTISLPLCEQDER